MTDEEPEKQEESKEHERIPTSTYPLEKLLLLWRGYVITPEQTIGYLLQHLIALQEQVRLLKQRPTPPTTEGKNTATQGGQAGNRRRGRTSA